MAKETEKHKELVKEYRKLAKRADQRLVRIEQYQKLGGKYLNIKEFAYKRAMVDIRKWSGEGATRFNTKPPANTTSLKAKISDIKEFLQAPTSTIKPTKDNAVYDPEGKVIIGGGIELTFQNRADSLNAKYKNYYDKPFTWENISDLFESTLWKKLDAKPGDSHTNVKAIGIIKKNEKKILDDFAKHKPTHIDVGEDDMVLQTQVNKILRYYKKDIRKLF